MKRRHLSKKLKMPTSALPVTKAPPMNATQRAKVNAPLSRLPEPRKRLKGLRLFGGL